MRCVWARYVNGQELGSTGEWATHSYHFDAPCGDGNVYAIHGVSRHDIAAIWVAFFSGWQRYRC